MAWGRFRAAIPGRLGQAVFLGRKSRESGQFWKKSEESYVFKGNDWSLMFSFRKKKHTCGNLVKLWFCLPDLIVIVYLVSFDDWLERQLSMQVCIMWVSHWQVRGREMFVRCIDVTCWSFLKYHDMTHDDPCHQKDCVKEKSLGHAFLHCFFECTDL